MGLASVSYRCAVLNYAAYGGTPSVAKERPIYLTGASGYLGSQIRALAPRVIPVARNEYGKVKGQVVIHAGCVVPTNLEEANDRKAQRASLGAMLRLIDKEPRFVVFTSTHTGLGTAYGFYKMVAETELRDSGIKHHIVRLPGLYGPPRRDGLVYNLIRGLVLHGTFTADNDISEWRGMWVREAAHRCLHAADRCREGMTVARDERLDALIEWALEGTDA